jgi:hypothetical protein
MKILISFLALMLTSLIAVGQDRPPNLAREELVGPVKTVESGRISYILNEGQRVEGKRAIFQKLIFNQRGYRVESATYGDGAISERLVYTYDVLDRNTGYEEYSRTLDKSISKPRKHVYSLDQNGRIVEYIVYEMDGTPGSRFTYEYDARGNKVEEDFYSWTGTRIGRLVYTYDEAGRRLTETSYDRDAGVSWKVINSYDAGARSVERTQYQGSVLRYKVLTRHDDKGRVVEQETLEFNAPRNLHTDHAPVPGKITYAYNDSDRTREVSTYIPNGALKKREVHTSDERGNETVWTNAYDGGTLLFKFEYDTYGNWTKKTRLTLAAGAKEPELQGVEYREITYF